MIVPTQSSIQQLYTSKNDNPLIRSQVIPNQNFSQFSNRTGGLTSAVGGSSNPALQMLGVASVPVDQQKNMSQEDWFMNQYDVGVFPLTKKPNITSTGSGNQIGNSKGAKDMPTLKVTQDILCDNHCDFEEEEQDNESDDIEANSPIKFTQSFYKPKDDTFFDTKLSENTKLTKDNLLLKSSRSTVLAEGEHHITMSTNNFNLDTSGFKNHNQQQLQLPYHSMDDQFINTLPAASYAKNIDWGIQQESGKKDNIFQNFMSNSELPPTINQIELEFQQTVKDLIEDIEEERKEDRINHQPVLSIRQQQKNHAQFQQQQQQQCSMEANFDQDILNEQFEELKMDNLGQLMQEALSLQRGRNSALDEVDDDDIVNQNSSRGSSKSRRQDGNVSPSPIVINNQNVFHITPASSSNIIVEHQRVIVNVEEHGPQIAESPNKDEEEVNTQMQPNFNIQRNDSISSDSSSKKRSGGRNAHSRFTYFAASSLSDDRWLCPICLDIYEDAVETPCCHNLFCEGCIKKTPTCPLCNLRIIGQLKPNIPIRRLVMELSVNCFNDNCEEIIRKGEIDKHLKVCPFTPIICPNNEICGKIIRKALEIHKTQECPYRIVECYLKCSLMLPLNDMQDHMEGDCPKMQILCKNKCGSKVERGEMEKHINIDCPLEIVDCPNKGESLFEEGCQVRLKRKEMESHKLTCNFRRVQCPNHKCLATIIYKDLQSHDERCLFKIIDCDNKCGQKIQRQFLDKHKQECQYQMVKCAYYDLGCHVETLRKNYVEHLQDEAFAHSMYFIEGQKKKNRQIDDLRGELNNLRELYDVEIQTMFLELNRVKEDMLLVKNKTGINVNQQNIQSQGNEANSSGPKIILTGNTGLGGVLNVKKDERRYEIPNSSAGSSQGVFDLPLQRFNLYRQQQQQQQKLMLSSQQNIGSNPLMAPQVPSFRLHNQGSQNQSNNNNNNQNNRQNIEIESNSGSIAAMMQSYENSSNNNPLVHNLISSQQYTNQRNNLIFANNPFLITPSRDNQGTSQKSESNRGVFSFRANDNNNESFKQQNDQQDGGAVRNNQTFQFNNAGNNSSQGAILFGENSQRGRISILPGSRANNIGNGGGLTEESKSNSDLERKNQIALFFGSINSSQESGRNTSQPTSAQVKQQLHQSYQMSQNQIEMLDFWRDVKFKQEVQALPNAQESTQQKNEQDKAERTIRMIAQKQRALDTDTVRQNRGGVGTNNSHTTNNNVRIIPTNQDLDSSNVLYDDDFEAEEEKHNY